MRCASSLHCNSQCSNLTTLVSAHLGLAVALCVREEGVPSSRFVERAPRRPAVSGGRCMMLEHADGALSLSLGSGVLRWGGSGGPRPPSSTPLDPRGTRTPPVGACIGHMGPPWRWCASKATSLGGRGRQIFRGHLDLSRFRVAFGEIVGKKKQKPSTSSI